jgi:hypothetical protein
MFGIFEVEQLKSIWKNLGRSFNHGLGQPTATVLGCQSKRPEATDPALQRQSACARQRLVAAPTSAIGLLLGFRPHRPQPRAAPLVDWAEVEEKHAFPSRSPSLTRASAAAPLFGASAAAN